MASLPKTYIFLLLLLHAATTTLAANINIVNFDMAQDYEAAQMRPSDPEAADALGTAGARLARSRLDSAVVSVSRRRCRGA